MCFDVVIILFVSLIFDLQFCLTYIYILIYGYASIRCYKYSLNFNNYTKYLGKQSFKSFSDKDD